MRGKERGDSRFPLIRLSPVPDPARPDRLPCGGLVSLFRLPLLRKVYDFPIFVTDIFPKLPRGELACGLLPRPSFLGWAQEFVVPDASGGCVGPRRDKDRGPFSFLRPPDRTSYQLESGKNPFLEVNLHVRQLRFRRSTVIQQIMHSHGPTSLREDLAECGASRVPSTDSCALCTRRNSGTLARGGLLSARRNPYPFRGAPLHLQ